MPWFILSEKTSRKSLEDIFNKTASEEVTTPPDLNIVFAITSSNPQTYPLVKIIKGWYLPTCYLFFLNKVNYPSITIKTASGYSPYLKINVFLV